jgi:23S rRNA A1618 N6-methylase RlmF
MIEETKTTENALNEVVDAVVEEQEKPKRKTFQGFLMEFGMRSFISRIHKKSRKKRHNVQKMDGYVAPTETSDCPSCGKPMTYPKGTFQRYHGECRKLARKFKL